jgi:hypothetical protein
MHRMNSTARRQKMVAASSSSTEEDVSLGADHGEESTPTCDAASSSTVSQCRSDVPSQQGQFTRKHQAQWKDDLSM